MRTIIIVLFLLVTQSTIAQQGSNLFNFITADINIQRNPVLRDLQINLEDANTGDLSGIDTNLVEKLVRSIKDTASSFVDNPFRIDTDSGNEKTKYIIKFSEKILSIGKLPDSNIAMLLKEFNKLTNKQVQNLLDRFSEEVIKNEFVSNIVYFITYTILTTGQIESITYSPSIPYSSAIANYLSYKINIEINNAMLQQTSKSILEKDVNDLEENLIDNLNKSLDNVFKKLNSEIITLINKVQTKIKEDIKNWNRLYLKGNLSLAATNGTGIFSGGTMLTYKLRNTSLSFFTNINFNSEIDTFNFHLYGLRVSAFGDNFEFDFLGSVYFGKEIQGLKTLEAGMGYTYRFSSGFTAGLAAFYTNNDLMPNADKYSLGLMLKISDNIPSVTFGFTGEVKSGEKTPLIQVNYQL